VVDGTQRYLYEPVALFDTTEQGSLRPLAIVIGDEVFEPAEAGPQKWRWEMAKFAVQVADGNYHELFVHLARTHLVVEAFVLATHRALAPKHPLSLLLLPHFQGTLFINNSAAGSLIAHGGPIEAIFAGTIETTQLAAADDRLAFDFAANMVPAELETRGVMGGPLTDFPYRDDALRVWNAIETWVRAYVDVYYDSDADVVADTELAAWSAEVMGQGAVQGFTAPHDRSSLALALTMVIFTGSAQHAAVNFPQRTLMTYAPNVTGAVWTPLDGPTTEARWVAMMPPIDKASLQLQTLELLGGVYFSQLGDYKNASFPYGAWFRDEQITRSGGPLERFRNDLREVEAEIEKANADRSVPYPYLLPTQIPQSINI
jgi:arachidonate 15-lipoxygenase